jgi:hypothetical protein
MERRRLDGLIAAAAVQHCSPALDFMKEDIVKVMDVNYTGTFLCTRACSADDEVQDSRLDMSDRVDERNHCKSRLHNTHLQLVKGCSHLAGTEPGYVIGKNEPYRIWWYLGEFSEFWSYLDADGGREF